MGIYRVESGQAGLRLDLFLSRVTRPPELEGLSRSTIQKRIASGGITLNGRKAKPGARLKTGDLVRIEEVTPGAAVLEPEPIPLDILYEDSDLIVVNKPPGMVVHPAAGRKSGTLVNALLHHCPDLPAIEGERRPGIVHRLDKDTSGVMVVAKGEKAFWELARQFKERRVRKEYLALVWGKVSGHGGVIERPVGRHRRDRKRMSSLYRLPRAREARTEWRVEDAFQVGRPGSAYSWVTLLRVRPVTGRTHQVRVHLADEGFPVVGDRVYGRKRANVGKGDVALPELAGFPRQALHAEKISFAHPRTGAPLEFCAPLPSDMVSLLRALKEPGLKFGQRQAGLGG